MTPDTAESLRRRIHDLRVKAYRDLEKRPALLRTADSLSRRLEREVLEEMRRARR